MDLPAAAMLIRVTGPSDLHLHRADGRCAVLVAGRVLAEWAEADTVMRNFAIVMLRQAGFRGARVAEVLGLTESYVSTLHAAAMRDGSAALVKHAGPGRPRKLAGGKWNQARGWRAQGVSDNEIGQIGRAHV